MLEVSSVGAVDEVLAKWEDEWEREFPQMIRTTPRDWAGKKQGVIPAEPQGKEVERKWPEEIYTFREAAARLRCSYHTVWRLVHRGKLKQHSYMSGRIPASEVERIVRGA
jgi:excisionase family DNA binding protein